MSDQPLPPPPFEELQRELDRQFEVVASRFDTLDRRLDALEQHVDSRFDEIGGQLDALSHRVLRLGAEGR